MKFDKSSIKMTEILILLTVGLVAGVVSGLIGVGGGIIIVPALVLFLGFTQHQAQGTSLAMMIPPVGILAVLHYYKSGNVDFRVAGLLCIGFVLGAWVGSKVAVGLPVPTLKKVYGVMLILIAVKLIFTK